MILSNNKSPVFYILFIYILLLLKKKREIRRARFPFGVIKKRRCETILTDVKTKIPHRKTKFTIDGKVIKPPGMIVPNVYFLILIKENCEIISIEFVRFCRC